VTHDFVTPMTPWPVVRGPAALGPIAPWLGGPSAPWPAATSPRDSVARDTVATSPRDSVARDHVARHPVIPVPSGCS